MPVGQRVKVHLLTLNGAVGIYASYLSYSDAGINQQFFVSNHLDYWCPNVEARVNKYGHLVDIKYTGRRLQTVNSLTYGLPPLARFLIRNLRPVLVTKPSNTSNYKIYWANRGCNILIYGLSLTIADSYIWRTNNLYGVISAGSNNTGQISMYVDSTSNAVDVTVTAQTWHTQDINSNRYTEYMFPYTITMKGKITINPNGKITYTSTGDIAPGTGQQLFTSLFVRGYFTQLIQNSTTKLSSKDAVETTDPILYLFYDRTRGWEYDLNTYY